LVKVGVFRFPLSGFVGFGEGWLEGFLKGGAVAVQVDDRAEGDSVSFFPNGNNL